jgi:HEAT repeat protein
MPLVRKPSGPAGPATGGPQGPDSLRSAIAEQRWAAARAAADDPANAERLIAALAAEPDARVREAMLTSLVRIRTPESTQGLLGLLRSDDAALRTGVLDALRLLTQSMNDFLPRLLQDADVDVRILSCELARTLPGEQATPPLCELLARESDVNVCAAAIDVIAETGDAAAVPALTECAKRFPESPFLQFAVSTAIERVTSRSGLPRA